MAHLYTCEKCGQSRTCNIAGCQGQSCVKICVRCIHDLPPLKNRSKKMKNQTHFTIEVWGLDSLDDPDDFSFSPPHQPHWDEPEPSGPTLMEKIAATMRWAERQQWWKGFKDIAPGTRNWCLVVVLRYDVDEGTPIAQWKWDGESWAPHATEEFNPVLLHQL